MSVYTGKNRRVEKEEERKDERRVHRKRKERKFEQNRGKKAKGDSCKPLSDLPVDTVAHNIMLFLNTREIVAFGSTSRYFQECFLQCLPIKELHTIPVEFVGTEPLHWNCNENHTNLMRAHYLGAFRDVNEEVDACILFYWAIRYGDLATAKLFYSRYPAFTGEFGNGNYGLIGAIRGAVQGGHCNTLDWLAKTFDPRLMFVSYMGILKTAFEEGTIDTVKFVVYRSMHREGWAMFHMFRVCMECAVRGNKVQALEWLYTDPDKIRFPGFEPLTGDFAQNLLDVATKAGSKDTLKWLQEAIKKQ